MNIWWIHSNHDGVCAEFTETCVEFAETYHQTSIYGSQTYMYDPNYTFVNPKIHAERPKLGPKLRHVCTFRSIYGSLPTPYVSGHVIYVITSISLSAEFLGYYTTSLWARRVCVSTENDLTNLSISRFPTRTAQKQASLTRRRETNRPFSINCVSGGCLLAHPVTLQAFTDRAGSRRFPCKLVKSWCPKWACTAR